MSTGIWSATSGAVGQSAALDVQANNIANAATAGYRADRSVFRQTLVDAMDRTSGTRSQRFGITRTVEADLRTGPMEQTGRPLDVALKDPASYFVVQTPNGERYTRAGNLQRAADGFLVTREGFPVLDAGHGPIILDPDAKSISISANGRVVEDGIESSQGLLTVQFANPKGLEKEGQVNFRARPEAGGAREVPTELEIETLEGSNASAVDGMTSLISTSRHFEMLTRVIEAFSALEQRTAKDIIGQ